MKIRRFRKSDSGQVAQLFHDTVRNINIQDYSEEQVKAWAPDEIYFRDWAQICRKHYTIVAEENDMIIGFAELEENGHIDCFYCHHDFLRNGVGNKLYDQIEEKAKEWELGELYAEVSITAKPFFHKMGFTEVQQQEVRTRGQLFINYRMRKYI